MPLTPKLDAFCQVSNSRMLVFISLDDSPALREGVPVSAGTELTFFLVAGTVLCFGFSGRMMLITL